MTAAMQSLMESIHRDVDPVRERGEIQFGRHYKDEMTAGEREERKKDSNRAWQKRNRRKHL